MVLQKTNNRLWWDCPEWWLPSRCRTVSR